jgi:hypothetical protein
MIISPEIVHHQQNLLPATTNRFTFKHPPPSTTLQKRSPHNGRQIRCTATITERLYLSTKARQSFLPMSSQPTSQRATTAALSSTARMVSHPYLTAHSRGFAYPREAPPKAPGGDGSNYYGPWGIPDPLAAAASYLPSNANSNAPTSCRCYYIRKKEWRAKPCYLGNRSYIYSLSNEAEH